MNNIDAHTKEAAIEWLVKLQSPSLSDSEEKSFFRWLEANPSHQQAYIYAEKLWNEGEALKSMSASSPSWFGLGTIFGGKSQWAGYSVSGVAAALLLVFCFNFLNGEADNSVYQTKTGEQLNINLADGSEITLNTDSRIEVAYSDNIRLIKLQRGEAFFDVSKDANRQFTVATDAGAVVVLGTQFSIDNSNDLIEVTVLEGKVGLHPDTFEQNKNRLDNAKVILTADQQLTLKEARQNMQPRIVSADSALSWRNNQLVFNGESLAEVVDEINRYYDNPLAISDEQLATTEVTAVIQLDREFDSTLTALSRSLELIAKLDNKTGVTTLHKKSNR